MEDDKEEEESPILRDIRRNYCAFNEELLRGIMGSSNFMSARYLDEKAKLLMFSFQDLLYDAKYGHKTPSKEALIASIKYVEHFNPLNRISETSPSLILECQLAWEEVWVRYKQNDLQGALESLKILRERLNPHVVRESLQWGPW